MRSDVFHKKPAVSTGAQRPPPPGLWTAPIFRPSVRFFFLTRTPDKHKINRYFFQQDQTLMEGSTWQ